MLTDGGAKKTNYLSEIVTHCIAGEDFEESEISEAKDIYEIQSVTWKWIILSARCGTLLPYPFHLDNDVLVSLYFAKIMFFF